jgi:hypothetical protein
MKKISLNRLAIVIAVSLIGVCVIPLVFIEAVLALFDYQIPVNLDSVVSFWVIAVMFRLTTVRRPSHVLVMRKVKNDDRNK